MREQATLRGLEMRKLREQGGKEPTDSAFELVSLRQQQLAQQRATSSEVAMEKQQPERGLLAQKGCGLTAQLLPLRVARHLPSAALAVAW